MKLAAVGAAAISVAALTGGHLVTQCAPPPPPPYDSITETHRIGAWLRSAYVTYLGGNTYRTNYVGGRGDGAHMSWQDCVNTINADAQIPKPYATVANDVCGTYYNWELGSLGYRH